MVQRPTPKELDEALVSIINLDLKNAYIDYAKSYARMARSETGINRSYTLSYTLNNTQFWRGPEARKVKDIIRREIEAQNENKRGIQAAAY